MAAARICYSPELQEAIAKQADRQQLQGTHISDGAVREAFSGLADRFPEVRVSCAWAASEEGAEPSEDRSTLSLRILPERFADPLGLKRFLRHELGQVADILDVTFGYGPVLPEGLAVTDALRRRFSLLWDCSIDGRIARKGGWPLHAREDYEAEFVRLFAGLPSEMAKAAVGQLWDGERPSYRSLVNTAADLATSPDATAPISAPRRWGTPDHARDVV